MENEILLQILSELKSLNVRQSGVEQRLDGVERRQVGLAEELMAFQEFTMQKFERLEKRFDGLENEQKKLNLIIENEIRPSIQTLAEGQVTMQGQLNRIEQRVTAHDEIVFRRVK